MSMRPTSMRPGAPASAALQSIAEDPRLAKYTKMKQLGVPFGAIRNTMERDGVEVPDGFLAPVGFDDETPSF